MLREFWRYGEELVPLFERAIDAQKRWNSLRQIAPIGMANVTDAMEAELRLVSPDTELERSGRMLMEGRSERGGEILVRLWLGRRLLRRGHIGKGHQEPGSGVFISGPHIHYPTSAFLNINSRRARSRVYQWDIPESAPLYEAMVSFAQHINVTGEIPEIRQ